ncbi:MAG: hypothetical protein D9V47_05330 [Clostridia bacterium]|nr:MAG: hypothetical protein D9V47_05330 [Clostridia bacterium]
MGDVKQIAIYGKGGVGKSTVAANLSVALQRKGRKVLQVGCSPKIDSTAYLIGGEISERPVLQQVRQNGKNKDVVMNCLYKGVEGIYAMEAGGPVPGEGCAGLGAGSALDLLVEYDVFGTLGVDLVIYDVLGDVTCGGFAQPIRGGHAKVVYLVTSGEMMALYSANNICISIADMKERSDVRIGGLINNMRGVVNEDLVMAEFSQRIGVPVIANLPRDPLIIRAESMGGTVMEHFPNSDVAHRFYELADYVMTLKEGYIPSPITLEDIRNILRRYQVAS